MPPTRRSISASVTSPLFACHQRLTSSGVVHARYTRCFGASNSRVIRICVSVGRVTVAVPLLVTAISFLLLFEFLEHDIELVEPLRPQALVALHRALAGAWTPVAGRARAPARGRSPAVPRSRGRRESAAAGARPQR